MPYLKGNVIAIWEGPTVAKIQNETLNEMVAGLWRIRDLEEYNMFIFIKVLVVFTKNAHVVYDQKFSFHWHICIILARCKILQFKQL
jgi:hypothetical protein